MKKNFKLFLIPIIASVTVLITAIFAKNATVQKSMSVTYSCYYCGTLYGGDSGDEVIENSYYTCATLNPDANRCRIRENADCAGAQNASLCVPEGASSGNTCTLTYYSNGGSTCNNNTGGCAREVTLCTPTRNGYTFDGWYTAPSGGSKVSSPYTLNSNTTLYAHWTENGSSQNSEDDSGYVPSTPTKYTLTYNVNGGKACSSTTKTATSGSKWGTLCTPTRSGYTFKEWNTKKNGSGTKVTSSSIASSNMTVYAQWTSSGSSTVSVTGIVLTPSTWKMKVGDTKELEATVTPTNATNKNVVWTSSDTSVATVNANGVVTGISPGTATITVTTIDGNKSATSKITVLANSEETPTNENEYVIITEVYYGNITDSDVVTEGSDKTIEYSPYEGYELSEIRIDGEEVSTDGIETQYTFKNVTEDHHISVIYVKEGDNTNPKTGVFEVGGILLIIVTFGGIAYFLTQKKKISNI